jgi:hypothetical protein
MESIYYLGKRRLRGYSRELRIAEQYLPQLGRIAEKSNTVVLPANLTDVGGIVAMARGMFKGQ